MKAYFILTLSILFEVFATTMLKVSEGFTVILPSIGSIVGYALSFYLIAIALKTLPLSFAYAIWAAAGTAMTAIIGILIWGELFSAAKVAGLLLIIGGVILLNISDPAEPEEQPSI